MPISASISSTCCAGRWLRFPQAADHHDAESAAFAAKDATSAARRFPKGEFRTVSGEVSAEVNAEKSSA